MRTSGSNIGSYLQFDTPAFIAGDTYHSVGIASDGTDVWFGSNGTTVAAGAYLAEISTTGTFLNNYAIPITNAFVRTVTNGPNASIWFTGGDGTRGIAGTIRAGKIVTYSTKTRNYDQDMTLGPDGNLWYISGSSPYVVGKITPNGRVTNYKLPKSYTKKFSGLGHIVSANGALWFSLPGINALAEATTAGALSLFPEPVGAQNGPAFLAVNGTTIYAADVGYLKRGHYIGRYTLQPFDTTNDTFGPQLTLTDPTFGAPGPMLPLIFNGGHVWFGSADQANNTSGLGAY